tara:strand:+ start:3396 stop:3695 length:300 start_codon:yes stop_codon:yes gene_type:complete
MSRYKFTTIQQEDTPRRGTLIYPYVTEHPEDIYVITTVGDRLDVISSSYYGDSSLWWIIASANPSIRRDSLNVAPGIQLRIPYNKQEVLKSVTKVNNQR